MFALRRGETSGTACHFILIEWELIGIGGLVALIGRLVVEMDVQLDFIKIEGALR